MFRSYVLLAVALTAQAATWKPIDPAELKDRTPKVEQGADAEALFWEVQLVDELNRGVRSAVLSNYLRIKIYNNRGRNRASFINIDVNPGSHVDEIDARTIHVDGTVVELSRDAIRETETTTGNYRRKQKSFPIPAVEPGSIIEYRWRETRDHSVGYVRMDFQRDIPVRIVRYMVKPAIFTPGKDSDPRPGITSPSRGQSVNPNLDSEYRTARNMAGMAIQDFQCNRTPLVKHGDFYETSMENVPAFKDEPNMPPPNQLRAWSLLYYHLDDEHGPAKYWEDVGKKEYDYFAQRIKPSKQVRALAGEITSKAETPELKLALLSDYCRTKIRNMGTEAVSAEERANAQKKNPSEMTPDEVLKEGIAPANNIRYLFASLAVAAGFEARIVLLPDRREIYFSPKFADRYFLRYRAVAVKLTDGWHFYDPADTYVPHDSLAWRFEGVPALIPDPKAPVFQLTPFSSVEQNSRKSKGVFKITDDGTLEGDAEILYTGQEGAERKNTSQRQSPEQRVETFKSALLAHLSNAELSNSQIENTGEIEKPITYLFHIRIPGYAQRTGKRLFFAPAVFQQGEPSVFAVKERKYPVMFSYSRSESDQFSFEIPDGFELKNPEIPVPVNIWQAGRYEVAARFVNGNTVIYNRSFFIGKDGRIGFAVAGYPQLKGAFDTIATSDAYAITLTQKGTSEAQR